MNAGGAGTSVGGNRTHSGWRQPQPAAQGGQRPLAPSMRIVEPAEPANILNKRWWMRPCLPIPASKRVSRRDTLKAERNGRGAAASTLSTARSIAVGPNQIPRSWSQPNASSLGLTVCGRGGSSQTARHRLLVPNCRRPLVLSRWRRAVRGGRPRLLSAYATLAPKRRFRVSGPKAKRRGCAAGLARFRVKVFMPGKGEGTCGPERSTCPSTHTERPWSGFTG